MLNITQIPKKLYIAKRFVQNSDDYKYCNYSIMDMLCKFYKIFRSSRSSRIHNNKEIITHVTLDNIFWKLHDFKMNIFSLPQFDFYF